MDTIGLTSQEAQSRLHHHLHILASRHAKISWKDRILHSPFAALNWALTVFTGMLLVLTFAVSSTNEGAVLFEGLFLISVAVLNAVLFTVEQYTVKTHSMRRLLGRVSGLLATPCPWTPASYPPKTLSTPRGHFTVPAFRDGVVVNLPTSLLVEGDVIQLWRGATAPADVRLLGSSTKGAELFKGCVVGDELFEDSLAEDSSEFTKLETPLQFEVKSSPLIVLLEQAISVRSNKSTLSQQLDFGLSLCTVLSFVYLLLSTVFNAVRYSVLREDFGPWPQMFLQLQGYSLLPLLCPALPSLWALANMYCTARVALLLAPTSNSGLGPRPCCRLEVLRQLGVLLVCPYQALDRHLFHTLGNLTSLCAVDKKDILTDTLPVPESVFFLSSLKQGGGGNQEKGGGNQEKGGGNQEKGGGNQKEGGGNQEKDEWSLEPPSILVDPPTSSTAPPTSLATLPTSAAIEVNKDSSLHVTFQEVSSNSLRDSVSVLSDPFSTSEVKAEVLNISLNPSSPSGISFDDPTWKNYIASLKPIGLGTLATSHVIKDSFCWYHTGTRSDLMHHLYNVQCMCALGMEIGVREYAKGRLEQEHIIYSTSDYTRIPSVAHQKGSSFVHDIQSCTVQPHMLCAVMRHSLENNGHSSGKNGHSSGNNEHSSGNNEHSSGNNGHSSGNNGHSSGDNGHFSGDNRHSLGDKGDNILLLSCGSAGLVTANCIDFWDGADVRLLTQPERHAIMDYYNRHSLTAYCTALSYSPLQGAPVLPGDQTTGLFIPHTQLNRTLGENSAQPGRGGSGAQCSPDHIISSVLSNQIFLGMVSMQYQPRPDVVALIESLHSAGIRFIHLTAENELKSKVFAEKLGLETGWNCHISLAPEPAVGTDSLEEKEGEERGSVTTGSVSSLDSMVNTYQSYICAKLPKGIDNIRPHLQRVDNVPLLVPLFTDCTAASMREMVEILQENGEVVMCMGSAWNMENTLLFSQANVGLALVPELDGGLASCLAMADCTHRQHEGRVAPEIQGAWSDPLSLSSFFNSVMCQLSLMCDHNLMLVSMVTECRWLLGCLCRALLFGLGTSITLATLMVLAVVFFLPPPLSGGHLFWFTLVATPTLMLSILTTPVDPSTQHLMPLRRRKLRDDLCTFVLSLSFTFVPTAVLSLATFGLTLHQLCTLQPLSQCHWLLGNLNTSSPWNGWMGTSEQSLVFAQDLTAFFFSLYVVVLSLRSVHPVEPLWGVWRWVSWPYLVAAALTILLQVVHFAVSEALATGVYALPFESSTKDVPFYVWILGFLWVPLLLGVQEVLKQRYRKSMQRLQRHLKLEFETKLGMNSPF